MPFVTQFDLRYRKRQEVFALLEVVTFYRRLAYKTFLKLYSPSAKLYTLRRKQTRKGICKLKLKNQQLKGLIVEEETNNWEENEVVLWVLLVTQNRQLFIATELLRLDYKIVHDYHSNSRLHSLYQ